MLPGEQSCFLCKREEVSKGLFSMDIPEGLDLVFEVEMLDWRGEDISAEKDCRLLKIIREEGSSKTSPVWTVKCSLKVTTIYGSKEHLFRLGDGCNNNIAPELETCALTMKKGEKCTLKTKDNKWEVELLSFERERKLWKMSSEEVYSGALELKSAGNIALQHDKLQLSRLYYLRSISYLDGISKSEQNDGTNMLSIACNSNLAIVCYRQGDYVASVSHATQVLWLDACNVKALYRRAKAQEQMGFLCESLKDLELVLQLDNTNKEAQALMKSVRDREDKEDEKEKIRFKKVFAAMRSEDAAAEALLPPVKSVWDEAMETCPAELATPEAYEVYKAELDAENARIKEERAKAEAERLAANPPKKKKKKKKKKKTAAVNEIDVTNAELVPKDDPAPVLPVIEPDVDNLVYEVTSEVTYVNKIKAEGEVNGGVNGEVDSEVNGQVNNGEVNSEVYGAVNGEVDDKDCVSNVEVNAGKCDVQRDVVVGDVQTDELNDALNKVESQGDVKSVKSDFEDVEALEAMKAVKSEDGFVVIA